MVVVEEHAGPRAALRSLFELAEDSRQELDAYIEAGSVLVAVDCDQVVGHVQMIETARPADAEIKSMAVAPSHQHRGIGHQLARGVDHQRLVVERDAPIEAVRSA